MTEFESERELLRAVRERLDGWIYDAREEAFEELFEGPDAVLTEAQLRLIDRVDSRKSREEGQGVWGSDEYGIVRTGMLDEESTPRVVCTNQPRIPALAYPGDETLDNDTRAELNDALWQYHQRIVELVQQRLEEFVWSADVATSEE